jgi:hypothetical protein
MNLCINCRYFRSGPFGPRYGRCTHYMVPPQPDPVMGEEEPQYAMVARLPDQKCGPAGDLFKPTSAMFLSRDEDAA